MSIILNIQTEQGYKHRKVTVFFYYLTQHENIVKINENMLTHILKRVILKTQTTRKRFDINENVLRHFENIKDDILKC